VSVYFLLTLEELDDARRLDFALPELWLLLGEDVRDDETLLGDDRYVDEGRLLLV
jgi:hypothetical protein